MSDIFRDHDVAPSPRSPKSTPLEPVHSAAAAIRKRREATGHSQGSFADKIEMHRTYYSAIERDEQNLTLGTLERICKGIGVKNVGGAQGRRRIAGALDLTTDATWVRDVYVTQGSSPTLNIKRPTSTPHSMLPLTNVVTELRKAKAGMANKAVTACANSFAPSSLLLSTIMVLELGILLMERRDHAQARYCVPELTGVSCQPSPIVFSPSIRLARGDAHSCTVVCPRSKIGAGRFHRSDGVG